LSAGGPTRRRETRRHELFPTTLRTWIEERLEKGEPGQAEVNRHLMDVYARSLECYLRRTPWRELGDPADLVRGFFADRLGNPAFLQRWRASGKRLRHWLANGLVFYAKETARRRRRDRAIGELAEESCALDPSPELVLDRAFAASIVRAALDIARSDLEKRGLEQHFVVFHEHEWNDVSYGSLAARLGVTADRARVMARTARDAFRRAVRGLLARDGATAASVDREIESLLESLR
jgi:DNA-directed RNA polymerase specialized sigma24 family protein